MAIGIAILKYRLYDIDVVIKKTVVYAILAVLLFGSARSPPGPRRARRSPRGRGGYCTRGGRRRRHRGLAAAGWPRIADRLVYGRRATPYQVLSEFSDRGGHVRERRRPGADGAGPGHRRRRRRGHGVAARPPGFHRRVAVGRDAEDAIPTAIEVRHQDEVLGAVGPHAGQRSDGTREGAADPGPRGAGRLVLRNAALIDDLRASRIRLVAAQNEERRRIERNIHDGAQQQLVALAVKLRLTDTLVGTDEARAHDARGAPDRDEPGARGPPRPRAGDLPAAPRRPGLGAALESQARKSAVPVTVDVDGIGRYRRRRGGRVLLLPRGAPERREVRGRILGVRAAPADERRLVVRGRRRREGFDPAAAERGTGLQGIADRLAALGGRLDVRSAPGEARRSWARSRWRRDDGSHRVPARVVPVGCGLVLLVLNVVLSVRADTLGDTGVFVFVYPIFLLAFATVGALIARPGATRSGGCSSGPASPGRCWGRRRYAAYARHRSGGILAARAADWVNIWFYGPGIFLPVTLLLLLFPDGRLPSRRWRPVLWIAIPREPGVLLGNAFARHRHGRRAVPDVEPVRGGRTRGVLKILVNLAFFGAIGGRIGALRDGAASRRSSGDERRQLRGSRTRASSSCWRSPA